MYPPVKQLEAMSTTEFFNALTQLMVNNPAYAYDAPALKKLAMIGVVPGEKFDPSKLDPAVVAMIGLGANIAADASYLNSVSDATGKPLNGANRYMLHFDKNEMPPANAFWSMTMYDADSFFVPNPLKRYNIAAWMPLKHNNDGSLDIYIQKDSPGKAKESNWLPAPAGDLSISFKVYWPKESMLDGSWKAPATKKIN